MDAKIPPLVVSHEQLEELVELRGRVHFWRGAILGAWLGAAAVVAGAAIMSLLAP